MTCAKARLSLCQTHSTDDIDDSFNWAKRFFLCFLKLPNIKRMQAKCLSMCDGLMMSRWPLSFISRCHVWCYDSHFEASRSARSKTVCSKLPLPDIRKRRDLNIRSCLIKHLNHWYSGMIASIFKCKFMLTNCLICFRAGTWASACRHRESTWTDCLVSNMWMMPP